MDTSRQALSESPGKQGESRIVERTRPRPASSRSRSPPRGVSRGGDRGRHSLAPPSVRSAGRGGRAAPGSSLRSAGVGSAGVGAAHLPGVEPPCGASEERGVAAPGRGEPGRGCSAQLGRILGGARYRLGPAATARRSPWRPPPVLPHLGRGARPRETKVTLGLTLR